MATIIVAAFRDPGSAWRFTLSMTAQSPLVALPVQHPTFNLVTGAWTDSFGRPWAGTWYGPADVRWQAWSAAAIAGVLTLAGYCLARRRQRRRGTGSSPRGPLSGFFPAVAASVFGVFAPAIFGLDLGGAGGAYVPGFAACLALAAGYSFRTVLSLRRHQRGQETVR